MFLIVICVLMKSLPLKRKTKIAADDTLIFYFYLSKKIRLDFNVNSRGFLETPSLIFSDKTIKKNVYECRLLQS